MIFVDVMTGVTVDKDGGGRRARSGRMQFNSSLNKQESILALKQVTKEH